MAASFFDSYGSTGLREDVSDIIKVISPDETPVLTTLPEGSTNAKLTEWMTIPLPTASDNTAVEGTAFAYGSGDAETRLLNYTQIFLKTWRVSGTVDAVGKYGRGREWEFRKVLNMRAHNVDVEYELLDNTASAAGASTATAREMKGLPGAAVDNGITATAISDSSSSAPISEPMLNSLLQDMWTEGVNPDHLVCGAHVKRGIGGILGVEGRPMPAPDGRLVISNAVQVYDTDFGRVNILTSRVLPRKSEVMVWENALAEKANLRPASVELPPKDGDYFPGALISECTFKYLNPKGFGRLTRVQSA